jgi:hypothetical protein
MNTECSRHIPVAATDTTNTKLRASTSTKSSNMHYAGLRYRAMNGSITSGWNPRMWDANFSGLCIGKIHSRFSLDIQHEAVDCLEIKFYDSLKSRLASQRNISNPINDLSHSTFLTKSKQHQ